jgi:CheY-like chemotaxis protein
MESPHEPPVHGRHPQAHIVLIVDDDPFMLDALSMMVSNMGISAHLASGGHEAVEVFQAQSGSISLVIMDVEMPGLGGIEAAQKIRDIDPSAKIILCSGHTKRDVWQAKPNAFLLKPFMHLDLRQVVLNLLEQE